MFKPIATSYFKVAQAIIIVFDVTSRESMLGCDVWVQDMIDSKASNCAVVAVGNKIDREDAREVSTEEAREHFEGMNPSLRYFEASALTGEGVDELFDTVVRMVVEGSTVLSSNENDAGEQGARRSKGDKCVIC